MRGSRHVPVEWCTGPGMYWLNGVWAGMYRLIWSRSRHVPVKLVASPDIYQLNGAWVEACTISWRFLIFPCYFCTFLARLGYFLRAFLAIS